MTALSSKQTPLIIPAVSPAAPASAPRLDFIDGLRGLAMLMVLLFHSWLYGGQWRISPPFGPPSIDLAAAVGYGHIGVNLFLVLSGFCLYWPFMRPGRPEPTLWAFAQKRCRRILPPFYVSLVLFWAFLLLDVLTHHHYHEDATSLRHVFLSLAWHVVMLYNLRPEYVLSINGVYWSLALEFSLYLLFPLLVEGIRRFGPWLTAALALAVDLGWRHAVAGQLGPGTTIEERFVLCNSLPGRCFEFAAGMVAAWAMARLGTGAAAQKGWSARFALRRFAGPICFGVCLASGTAGVWVTERFGGDSTFPDALWGLCFASLVVAAIRPGSLLHRALSTPMLVGLGVFSYSVYLVHQPLSKALDAAVRSRHLSNTAEIAFQLFIVIPLMLLLGYVFHRFFERPFMTSPPAALPPARPA